MFTLFLKKVVKKISNMKKVFIFFCLCLFFSTTLFAQNKISKYSVSAGLNLFAPTWIYQNKENFKNHNPSWQVSINRDFNISSISTIRVSIGLRKDLFTAQKESYINVMPDIMRIKLGYAYTEIDYILHKKMNTYTFFGGIGLRGSLLGYENITKHYPFISSTRVSSSEFGGSLLFGVKFSNISRKPSLQLNYYHSFTKTVDDYSVDSINGTNPHFDDKLKGRSIVLQLTLNLKKSVSLN